MSMFAGPSWGGNRMRNILYGTAIFELVLAGVFLVMGRGFTLTAVILGVVALGLIAWARKAGRAAANSQRLKAMGIPGQADITAVRQTGVVLNEINPQVELDLTVRLSDGRAPYPVKVKEFVPGIAIGRLSNGQPLPVRVDPVDPQNVVILWEQGSVGGAMGAPMVAGVPVGGAPNLADPEEKADQAALDAMRAAGVQVPQMTSDQFDQVVAAQRERIMANGITGTMVVKGAKDTGQTINDRRLFQMESEITLSDGRPPYRLDNPAAVPAHVADRIRKGFSAPVTVDKDDPRLTVIEWDQGLAP
ncbi:MAG TPA: hypothetical protein VGB28_02495 [Actinomycetota bacterium]